MKIHCNLDRGTCTHQYGDGYMTGCSSKMSCEHQDLSEKILKDIKDCLSQRTAKDGVLVSMGHIRKFVNKINKNNALSLSEEDFLTECKAETGYLCDGFDASYIIHTIQEYYI